jgi:hypothetical protein
MTAEAQLLGQTYTHPAAAAGVTGLATGAIAGGLLGAAAGDIAFWVSSGPLGVLNPLGRLLMAGGSAAVGAILGGAVVGGTMPSLSAAILPGLSAQIGSMLSPSTVAPYNVQATGVGGPVAAGVSGFPGAPASYSMGMTATPTTYAAPMASIAGFAAKPKTASVSWAASKAK